MTAPWSPEAERAVLCCCLLDAEQCLAEGLAEVTDDWFYKQAHRATWGAIRRMLDREEPITLVGLGEDLIQHRQLDHAGGTVSLAQLLDVVPSAAHFPHFFAVLRRNRELRILLTLGVRVQILVRQQTDPDAIRAEIEEALDQQYHVSQALQPRSLRDLMPEVRPQVAPAAERASGHVVASGVPAWDAILGGGFRPGSLNVLAGRPSMGKSSLALKVARHVARERPVLLLSLEMSSHELVKNLLSLESRVNSYRIRQGDYEGPYAHGRVLRAASGLESLPLYLSDAGDMDLPRISAAARRMAMERGLGLLVIDYLQLLGSPGTEKVTRDERVAALSRGCKILAKKLSIPVLLLSQLNREVDSRFRKGHRPRLSDLRESGAIEQDADTISFLFREGYYDKELGEREQEKGISRTELIVGKQRLGPVGTVLLHFHLRCGDFEPLPEGVEL